VDNLLRVHTDANGIVWCGQTNIRAFCTNMTQEEFTGRSLFRDAPRVRVLGVPANSELVIGAYLLRRKQTLGFSKHSIEIGSPMLCYSVKRMVDPVFVLQQLWQSDITANCVGTWHEMTATDYNTHLLSQTLKENGGKFNEKAGHILKYHPAWTAISFIRDADLDAAAKLVCEIMDPRWYNHPQRPNRASRLFNYLGLTPENLLALRGLLHPHVLPKGHNWHRAEMVLNAWRGNATSRGSIALDDPNNFLWRISGGSGDDQQGVLKASRVFVQFIRLVWLQALAAKGRMVFDKGAFFRADTEVKAFDKHCSQLNSL